LIRPRLAGFEVTGDIDCQADSERENFMINEITLPSELNTAASCLEQRLQLLCVPTRKVPLTEWSLVPENIHGLIPSWVPTLLASFSLCGGVLECKNYNKKATWECLFGFNGPEQYKEILLSRDYVLETEILEAGFVPISDEQNGDFWVTSIKEGPSSPIYLFSLSGMERIFASSRIALLISSMAVSERSWDDQPGSVMWHPEI
jgi:hypothetical protein